MGSKRKERDADGIFLYNTIVSILSIALCAVALSATTWAWFRADVTSRNNVIHSAIYEASISVCEVEDDQGAGGAQGRFVTVVKTIYPEAVNAEGHHFALSAGKKYQIVLRASGSAERGFYQVSFDGRKMYTDAVMASQATINQFTVPYVTDTLTFFLSFGEDTRVSFLPCWGIYSGAPNFHMSGSYEFGMDEWRTAQAEKEQQGSQPPVSDEPATGDEPVIDDEPTTADEPEISDEPTTGDEPVIDDEPTTDDELVIGDEPTTGDEPVIDDELITDEESS